MGNRVREFINALLPWYEPAAEKQRDAKTESIRRRSIASRLRAERVIDEYRKASKAEDTAGEALIDEVRRDDK